MQNFIASFKNKVEYHQNCGVPLLNYCNYFMAASPVCFFYNIFHFPYFQTLRLSALFALIPLCMKLLGIQDYFLNNFWKQNFWVNEYKHCFKTCHFNMSCNIEFKVLKILDKSSFVLCVNHMFVQKHSGEGIPWSSQWGPGFDPWSGN